MLAIGSASWTFVLCALPTIPLVFYLHGILGRSPFDFFTSPQVEFFILKKKSLLFVKIVVLLWLDFPEILSEISPLPFFWSKKNKKNTMYFSKKSITFSKIVLFLWVVSLKFWLKSHLSPFFMVEKHDVPYKKTATFCEI